MPQEKILQGIGMSLKPYIRLDGMLGLQIIAILGG